MIAVRLIGLFCLFCSAVSAASDGTRPRVMNLNDDHDMAEVAKANPAHFKKIEGIMQGIMKPRKDPVEKWIKVTFKADNVIYTEILLVSFPPKRRLSFVLDEVRYEGLVTLSGHGSKPRRVR